MKDTTITKEAITAVTTTTWGLTTQDAQISFFWVFSDYRQARYREDTCPSDKLDIIIFLENIWCENQTTHLYFEATNVTDVML